MHIVPFQESPYTLPTVVYHSELIAFADNTHRKGGEREGGRETFLSSKNYKAEYSNPVENFLSVFHQTRGNIPLSMHPAYYKNSKLFPYK